MTMIGEWGTKDGQKESMQRDLSAAPTQCALDVVGRQGGYFFFPFAVSNPQPTPSHLRVVCVRVQNASG
jgi:hypothetical protein